MYVFYSINAIGDVADGYPEFSIYVNGVGARFICILKFEKTLLVEIIRLADKQ